MKTIKRFDLSIEPRQTISIPFNSEIIAVGGFNNKPTLWAVIDTAQKEINRTVLIFHEGKELPQEMNRTRYLGRFEYKAEVGAHALHLFEE